jgi:hypothetical protein
MLVAANFTGSQLILTDKEGTVTQHHTTHEAEEESEVAPSVGDEVAVHHQQTGGESNREELRGDPQTQEDTSEFHTSGQEDTPETHISVRKGAHISVHESISEIHTSGRKEMLFNAALDMAPGSRAPPPSAVDDLRRN